MLPVQGTHMCVSRSVGDAPSHLPGQGLHSRVTQTGKERPCTSQNAKQMLRTGAAAFPDPDTAMFTGT